MCAAENNQPLRAQVLIVEDEPDHADVMAEALRRPGHVSTVVGSVDEAMEELRPQDSSASLEAGDSDMSGETGVGE